MGYILLVESHAGLRNWCRMHLSTAGHDVSTADDARRALKLVRTRAPDLILIATDLEDSSAFALVTALRAEPRAMDTPMLLLAPAEDARAIAQALAVSPGSVLTKPMTREALLSAVSARLQPPLALAAETPIAASAAPPAAPAILSIESKTVSVLIVTLRNFVSLARSLRSKTLDALIQRFLAQAREAVVAQGGWPVRIDATGMLAVFENSPHARHNHASVAVETGLQIVVAARRVKQWAALKMRDPEIPSLSVGCGVHSGEVVVARLPFGGHIAPSLAGVTVDIAARLNGRAKGLGWSVAVSETAAQLAGSRFHFGRRATLTDTEHELTITILECVGFTPGSILPEELALMAEVREAVEANTLLASLAGDVDPQIAERTILVRTARTTEERPPEIPERRMGRRLGHGRQVTTYTAQHLPTGREEAVKTVLLDQAPAEALEHYLAIYRRFAELDRRHVVAIHEVGRSADAAYVAAELLHGPGLNQIVRKRVPIGTALNLTTQICRALDAAHRLGLFHGALRAEHFMSRDPHTLVLMDCNASTRAWASLAPDDPAVPHALETDRASAIRADLTCVGLILLAMLSPDSAVMESALAGKVASLPEAARLPMQLSSLQPLIDGLLGLDASGIAYQSAAEVLGDLAAVEELWGRPAAAQE